MEVKTVLGIFRAACYSPGMVGRDEAILRAVAERLEKAGHIVNLIHEEDFTAEIAIPDVVIHMARSSRVLDILQQWQEEGCCVINSVESVRSVERASLAELCAEQGIPTPKTWIVNTTQSDVLVARTTVGSIETIVFPCWVKRTGSCAQEPDDVCRVDDIEAYRQCLASFRARDINKVVVMEHIEGPCLKFYAVQPLNRFQSYNHTKDAADFLYITSGYDKWSLANAEQAFSMDSTDLKVNSNIGPNVIECDKIAWTEACILILENIKNVKGNLTETKGLQVFGGDFIIDADGIARLIDLNDWPSFSACCDDAADAITNLVLYIFYSQ